jgi:hypothetical protein
LFKLAAIALTPAVRTIQLVDARDGSERPASDVADEDLIRAADIGPKLERNTARQKNPHPARSLAWLSWIAARLGGWNCYYKPPGPKTMRAVGTDSVPWRSVMPLQWLGKMRESGRAAWGGRV